MRFDQAWGSSGTIWTRHKRKLERQGEADNQSRLRAFDQRICVLPAGKAGVSQAAS